MRKKRICIPKCKRGWIENELASEEKSSGAFSICRETELWNLNYRYRGFRGRPLTRLCYVLHSAYLAKSLRDLFLKTLQYKQRTGYE